LILSIPYPYRFISHFGDGHHDKEPPIEADQIPGSKDETIRGTRAPHGKA
jgi:hypothetical protein